MCVLSTSSQFEPQYSRVFSQKNNTFFTVIWAQLCFKKSKTSLQNLEMLKFHQLHYEASKFLSFGEKFLTSDDSKNFFT